MSARSLSTLRRPVAGDRFGDASIAPIAGAGRPQRHEGDRQLRHARRDRNGDAARVGPVPAGDDCSATIRVIGCSDRRRVAL
jgi:hypothetical protein